MISGVQSQDLEDEDSEAERTIQINIKLPKKFIGKVTGINADIKIPF